MRTLILIALLFLFSACNEQKEENVDRLKRFYSYYITHVADLQPDDMINKDTLEEYCSQAFLHNIYYDTTFDYDPLLTVKGSDKNWVNTLMVTKGSQTDEKLYRVSYLWDAKRHLSHNIVVTMVKVDGYWKIDFVRDNDK